MLHNIINSSENVCEKKEIPQNLFQENESNWVLSQSFPRNRNCENILYPFLSTSMPLSLVDGGGEGVGSRGKVPSGGSRISQNRALTYYLTNFF